MSDRHDGDGRQIAIVRFGVRRAAPVLTALCLGLTTACTSSSAAPSQDAQAAAVVNSLGAVPVPTVPASDPTPTAAPGAPQLLAMGVPALAVLDPNTRTTVTASGPDQVVTTGPGGTPAKSTAAIITLTAVTSSGSVVLGVGDLVCRDDGGNVIALTPVGPASAEVPTGGTGAIRVSGVFRSGAAQITWRPGGHTIALWDFTIELD